MPVTTLAQFLATWALSSTLIGVVFGPRMGILIGLIIAVVYWVAFYWAPRIRNATLSSAATRPIQDR